jgi:hypothetical protein
MRKITKKQLLVAGVATAVVAAGAGVAFAYWTSSGSGSGSASTGNVDGITINQTSTVTGLYPGGPSSPLSGDFTNSNASQVYVSQVSVAVQAGWSAQADSTKPECTAGDFTLVQPAATNAEIASGTHVGSWGAGSIALNDSATNQDNCKDVSVPLVYTSN